MSVDDVLAQQTMLYGEPLAARFGRLLDGYRISQSRLAGVIGLSAPMLSQLASGQRVKISNPAVHARLIRLEELSRSPAVLAGDPAVLRAVLDDVAGSRPQLTTEHATGGGHDDLVAHLASIAGRHALSTAASAVAGTPLGELLHAAAARATTA